MIRLKLSECVVEFFVPQNYELVRDSSEGNYGEPLGGDSTAIVPSLTLISHCLHRY